MPEFTVPSRKGLVLGAVQVALHGLLKERGLAARHANIDFPQKHEGYVRCERALDAVRNGQTVRTLDEQILDLMAHTQQTLRLSYEEWDAYSFIVRATEFSDETI